MFARQFGAVALEVGGTIAGYVVGMKHRHPYLGGFVGFVIGGGLGWWVARPVIEEQERERGATVYEGPRAAPIGGSFQFIPPMPARARTASWAPQQRQ